VNFLAASPLLKGLVRGAIAESHTTFGRMLTLAEAEANGVKFASAIGKNSLADLRAAPASELLEASIKNPQGLNGAIVDGWFLPQDLYTTYSQGRQNDIFLITGATNDEGGNIGGGRGATAPDSLATYTTWAKQTFGDKAGTLLKLYPARDDAQAKQAYHDVYRDINFAGHRTWARLQSNTAHAPAWIYLFSHVPPHPEGNGNNPRAPVGAVHFSEVIYVFNNLRMKDYPWTDLDRKVADTLAAYWTNFAKTGNPNGPGLTNWPGYSPRDEFLLNIGDTVRLERFNSAGVDFIAAVQEELRRAR
jgi:para-nitrobenzyl esterase